MNKKKLLTALCIVVGISLLMLGGCGSSGGVSAGSSSGGGSSTASEDSSEETEYPITVEDNDYFTFEITDYDDVWNEYSYKITNKLDKDITFNGDKVIINDETTIDSFIYGDIGADTSITDSFYIDNDQLSEYEDGETLKLVVKYEIYDSNNYDNITKGKFNFNITK